MSLNTDLIRIRIRNTGVEGVSFGCFQPEPIVFFVAQEQTTEDVVMLNGFGTIVNSLGKRVKPYLPQICGTILWRLNNKSAKVRQQAADLISRIAVVMKTCQEEKLMGHLGVSHPVY